MLSRKIISSPKVWALKVNIKLLNQHCSVADWLVDWLTDWLRHLDTQGTQGTQAGTWALKAFKGHLGNRALKAIEEHVSTPALRALGHLGNSGTWRALGHSGTQGTWALGHSGTCTIGHSRHSRHSRHFV